MNTDKQIKNYIQRQKNWIKANNLKRGDKVLVTKAHPSNEKGWDNNWVQDMDHMINVIGTVLAPVKGEFNKEQYGIRIQTPQNYDWFWFPYTVLRKVE